MAFGFLVQVVMSFNEAPGDRTLHRRYDGDTVSSMLYL